MAKTRDLSGYISGTELKKEVHSHILKNAEILRKEIRNDKNNLKDNGYLINA
ncbi:MAG: hypothetical protein PHF46_02550 [Candidatus Gracilibacteria bacterium]|nr:hypothetical protein [Candidatus Gracilibacteria bacterium]MDD4530333.1 hypothetical protein [Candidatus Gracilibacteria bacterium]